jgi:serine-rich repeat adhesion-like glycoprotein
MSDQILGQPELADVHIETDSEDISRSEVILKGALAAGAVYGALAVGPFVGRALAMSESGDVGILNFALTLEYLEAAFYKEAKTRAKASGDLKSLIELIGRDEEEHVGALTETVKKLGGKPVAEPKFDFPYSGTAGFLKLAQTFEDTGVSAYNGAAPKIKASEVLEAAGSIVQVEARHAAAIRLQNEEEPAPEAFDPALPEAKVLKAVEPFIE